MVNEKYSFNGYDPKSPAIIAAKAALKAKLAQTQIPLAQYDAAVKALDAEYHPEEEMTPAQSAEYAAKKHTLDDKRWLPQKEYTAAITAMKTGKRNLLDVPAEELNGTEIVGSDFHQDEPFTKFIRDDVKDVVLVDCNADNCLIPPGVTIRGGTNKQHKLQKDGEEWIVNDKLEPVTPFNEKQFRDLGLSLLPKDIPADSMEQSVVALAVTSKMIADRKAKLLEIASDPAKLDLYGKGEMRL